MKASNIGLWISGAFLAFMGWIMLDMSSSPASARADGASSISEVRTATVPVLVEFYADWCGPCRAVGPEVERLAAEVTGKAKVLRINIDEQPGAASAHGVRAVPTFICFRAGKEVSRQTGAIPRAQMKAMLGF
ncbi:MAG: thioredoxin family protein [Prosthecobacter sp.]|nr:thioredoxin family protein [Prosthecobacter sp.]